MRSRATKHTATTHTVVAACENANGTLMHITTNAPRLFKRGGGIHAEVRVLRRAPKSVRTVYIARFGKSGNPLPIEPCESCARLARKLGVRVVSLT